jgi:hypothetical protein
MWSCTRNTPTEFYPNGYNTPDDAKISLFWTLLFLFTPEIALWSDG